MWTIEQIEDLLPDLDHQIADEFEGQYLDFKEWDGSSKRDSIQKVVDMAICMANGGGGTVVFGVADKVKGRDKALSGIPQDIDLNLLKKAVYDRTDPKITPVFEELYPQGSQTRLIVMQIHQGIPPYTDTNGKGKIRIGKECKPLTGSHRKKIGIETGENDFTATVISAAFEECISSSAMEQIRDFSRKEHAPTDLLRLSDCDLLQNLEIVNHEKITRAGLLLAGSKDALKVHIPGYSWTYMKMESDTQYSHRSDGNDPISIAIQKIEKQIAAHNPLTTIRYGLFHFEYRSYPEIAIREALLNAFCHCDFRLHAPIIIKHFNNRLEISNPGGFIGGITPSNILHHQPVSRNPCLVNALVKMRLVNRGNLGIGRMYEALLVEGKQPPYIAESGDSVSVTFESREFSPEFRAFAESCSKEGHPLEVDELIVIQYLLQHLEGNTAVLSQLCQREDQRMRNILSQMEKFNYIERGGSGRGTYWTLSPQLYSRLHSDEQNRQNRRIIHDAAKTRVFSILKERAARREEGISNKELRRITHYNRMQVTRLMKELRSEHPAIVCEGHGAGARYRIDLLRE